MWPSADTSANRLKEMYLKKTALNRWAMQKKKVRNEREKLLVTYTNAITIDATYHKIKNAQLHRNESDFVWSLLLNWRWIESFHKRQIWMLSSRWSHWKYKRIYSTVTITLFILRISPFSMQKRLEFYWKITNLYLISTENACHFQKNPFFESQNVHAIIWLRWDENNNFNDKN